MLNGLAREFTSRFPAAIRLILRDRSVPVAILSSELDRSGWAEERRQSWEAAPGIHQEEGQAVRLGGGADTWSPNVVCKKAAQYSGQRGLEVAVSGPDAGGRSLRDGE